VPPRMSPTEATRAELINPQLEQAEWNLSDRTQIAFEVPVAGYDKRPWSGFTDFSLYDADGTVLAVIEAKKTARDAREGEAQLKQRRRFSCASVSAAMGPRASSGKG
jgi:type I restriction enzyme, R subunit